MQVQFSLTQKAYDELTRLYGADAKPGQGLRVSVKAGGCSGLLYSMAFVDAKTETDIVTAIGKLQVYIDKRSAQFLQGVQLNFDGGLNGKGFEFQNPNAKRACGCGASFGM